MKAFCRSMVFALVFGILAACGSGGDQPTAAAPTQPPATEQTQGNAGGQPTATAAEAKPTAAPTKAKPTAAPTKAKPTAAPTEAKATATPKAAEGEQAA